MYLISVEICGMTELRALGFSSQVVELRETGFDYNVI